MKVFVPEFWPLFRSAGSRRFDYRLAGNDKVQFSSEFSFDPATNSMLYVDSDADGQWIDTWFYQYRPGFGIAEWRDDYPGKTKTFLTPIGWGEYQDIGSVYENRPVLNPFKTWPPTLALVGKQLVSFENYFPSYRVPGGPVYANVLQTLCQQTFGGKTVGVRTWMARGLGPIALAWASPDPATGKLIVTAPYYATVTSTLVS